MSNQDKNFGQQDHSTFFISSLSHELRTPIHGIVGYSQLLSQTRLNATQQVYVNSISSCCLQLVNIINDILDFSRLSSNKVTLNKECFNLKDLFNEVNSTLSHRFLEKKQKVFYNYGSNLPEYILGDRQKIIQILVNLLTNASKFTPIKGRILVNVLNDSLVTQQKMLKISIEDNGIGIPIENQKKLFAPFYQVTNTTSADGTGLGLIICKKLIELMGGDITVESDKDKGSIFTFTINYDIQDDIKLNTDCLTGKYILVIDGNLDDRVLLGDTLFNTKANPIVCASSKEALEYIIKKRYVFSLLIIDSTLNDIPVASFIKKIKESDPELPIVISTETGVLPDLIYDKILNKPLNKNKIISLILNIVKKNDISSFCLNEDEPTFGAKKKESIESKNKNNFRILVTEDFKCNLDMLVTMLENMGYDRIDKAEDGDVALNLLDKAESSGERYDLLLLDLKMPKVSGIEVAEKIKQREMKIKIVVLTGSILDSDRLKCKELGISYFLMKPISMNHLKNILAKIDIGQK